MSGLKSIASLLSYPKHGQVREIMEEQALLMKLICSTLPSQLSESCRFCLRKGRTLIIYADTAGMASQIRFYSALLTKELGKAGDQGIETVEIRRTSMQVANHHSDLLDPSRPKVGTQSVSVPSAIADIKQTLAEPDFLNRK
jgi:Dna[CI] antecedent, DciA